MKERATSQQKEENLVNLLWIQSIGEKDRERERERESEWETGPRSSFEDLLLVKVVGQQYGKQKPTLKGCQKRQVRKCCKQKIEDAHDMNALCVRVSQEKRDKFLIAVEQRQSAKPFTFG